MPDDASRDDEESTTEDEADALEVRPDDGSATRPLEDSAYPSCPRCGETVAIVVTTGPMEHVASPCGCRLGSPEL